MQLTEAKWTMWTMFSFQNIFINFIFYPSSIYNKMSLTGVITPTVSADQTGGRTMIHTEDWKGITYRPFPVDRMNVNVGERSIVGIPYLRDGNMTPVMQNTTRSNNFFFAGSRHAVLPRLGSTRSLQMSGAGQDGGNIFKDAWKEVKKVGRQTGVTSIVKDVAKETKKIVDDPVGELKSVAKEGVKDLKKTVKSTGRALGEFAKDPIGETVKEGQRFAKDPVGELKRTKLISRGLQVASYLGQPEAGALSTVARLGGFGQSGGHGMRVRVMNPAPSAGPAGYDSQSFVPTHPLNFNRARLSQF